MSDNSFVFTALSRIAGGIVSSTQSLLLTTGLILWDLILTVLNLILPSLPANRVVAQGKLGANGAWPKYIPPGNGASRCSCPALNAMANHGVIPRDGRDITFRELNTALQNTYNFAPTFCFFVPHTIAGILDRSYWTGRFDLSDVDVHNGIEHDASLTREDSYYEPDQSKVSVKLVEDLLHSGTGPHGDLTVADLSEVSAERRAEAKRTNPQFSLSFSHKMFGSSNSSTMLTAFGGKTADLRSWLVQERLPDGWQPKIGARMGLTILQFNATVLQLELGIKDKSGKGRNPVRRTE